MSQYDYYIDQYKKAHEDPSTFPGISIRYYINDIGKLIRLTSAKTLLDFGCGKGEQYTNKDLMKKWGGVPSDKWGIMPTLYDPAVESHNQFPEGKFDGVISTDVMEHVPEDSIDIVLEQIYSKADKFVFLAIATYLGKSTSYKLPNGKQPHITVRQDRWWIDKIKPYTSKVKTMISFNGRVNGKQKLTQWKNFK